MLSEDGAAIDETISRADGTYVFSPVDPGEVAVLLTLPEAMDTSPTPGPRIETDVVNVFSHDGSDDERVVRTGPLSVEPGGVTEANAGLAAVAEVAPTTTTTTPATTVGSTVPGNLNLHHSFDLDQRGEPAPTPTADDGDGIAATIEDAAPNGGDGNRDGLVDSRQSNVASLPAAVDVNGNGALDDYVTIVAPEGTTLTNVRALKVPSDNPPPDGVSLPYGLFEYEVTVASPGDTADVTYVLPDEGVEPTSVHMLQNGEWTDYADHTSLDSVNGKVTVTLRDGGEGDETGAVDGVIKDPSGVSTSNQTISVTNSRARRRRTSPSGSRAAQRRPERLHWRDPGRHGERLGQRRRRQRRAQQMAHSWFWGSTTALEYDRNYRLSVVTPLPASGCGLIGRSCNPNGIETANSDTTAIVMRLNDTSDNRRAACTFTFTSGSGTITVRKGGPRNTAGNNAAPYATGLQGATFEFDDNSAFSSPSDLCVTPMSTDATGACVSAPVTNGNYLVREKAAPAGWNTIPNIAYRRGRVRSESDPAVPRGRSRSTFERDRRGGS